MVRSVTPGAVRAVTFDYWQTLVSERPGEMRTFQVDRVAAILDDARQSRDRAALETAFTENWTRFERNWLENLGPYTRRQTRWTSWESASASTSAVGSEND